MDESNEDRYTSQLILFILSVVSAFSVHEELVCSVLFNGIATGEDLFLKVKEIFDFWNGARTK